MGDRFCRNTAARGATITVRRDTAARMEADPLRNPSSIRRRVRPLQPSFPRFPTTTLRRTTTSNWLTQQYPKWRKRKTKMSVTSKIYTRFHVYLISGDSLFIIQLASQIKKKKKTFRQCRIFIWNIYKTKKAVGYICMMKDANSCDDCYKRTCSNPPHETVLVFN